MSISSALIYIVSLPPHHSRNKRNAEISRLLCSHLTTPAALTAYQTSHQYIHPFLPFRRKKSGRVPDVWHFILHSASPSSSLSFSVFLLHLTNMFCSRCFCSCLLPLTPPSRSSFLFSFTLAPLPSQPEVNRDPLLRLACRSLTLSKMPHGSKAEVQRIAALCEYCSAPVIWI